MTFKGLELVMIAFLMNLEMKFCIFQRIFSMHVMFSELFFGQDTQLLLTGGVEKILRLFDMNRLDAPPREVDNSPGSIRTVAWLHSDKTILSFCIALSFNNLIGL